MPAPMFVPPWLQQSADPASQYARGTQIGLAEAAAQAQMAEFAQRQQLAQQELQMEQQKLGMMAEENKQKHLEAQQALAIDKTYRDMQLTAQKRQLDMAGQLMQQRTQQAAQQAAAMMEWSQFNQQLDANPNLDDTAKDTARRSKLFQLSPMLSAGHLAGISQLVRPPATIPEPMEKTLPSGEKIFWTGKSWSLEKTSTVDSGKFLDTGEASRLRTDIDKLEDEIRTGAFRKKQMLEDAKASLLSKQKKLNELDKRYGHPLEHPEVEGTPKSKAESGEVKVLHTRRAGEPAPELSPAGPAAPAGPSPWSRPTPPGFGPVQSHQPAAPAVPSAGLPKSMVPQIQERAILGIGKALRSPLGKALADIFEGIAGADDLTKLGTSDVQERVKALRDEILEVTK